MPLELDEIDIRILNSLAKDGRKSFRVIANEVGVTTPTVRARVQRLQEIGLIKGFSVVIDPGRFENLVNALVFLKVEPSLLHKVTNVLGRMEEVRGVYLTSGDFNLMARILVESMGELQGFIDKKIAKLKGVGAVATQIITKIVKDEPAPALPRKTLVSVKCDTCGQEIAGKPLVLDLVNSKRYFCCKSCLHLYKEKYGKTLQRALSP